MITRIEREVAKIIQAIKDGVPRARLKDEMAVLVDRQERLQRELREASDPKPLLHPGMADLYREKVSGPRQALEREEARPKAAESSRGLIEAIVLEPEGDRLRIVLQGNLAAMLQLAHKAKRPSESDDLNRALALVAGACNRRYRDLEFEALAVW